MKKYRFIKNSNLDRPKNINKETYISASYGEIFEYSPRDNPLTLYAFNNSITGSTEYKILRSLKNTINYYSAIDDLYHFENFYNNPISLLCFNSLHLGAGISKGSVKLNIYVTGSLLASCSDLKENGILYDDNKSKIGIVLYNEGFILINNTSSITEQQYTFSNDFGTIEDNLKWSYFCNKTEDSILYDLEYLTRNEVVTNTYFVVAGKNELNHSNNFTYIESGSYHATHNEAHFIEDENIKIKKTNKSPFISGSANFEKQTFITNVCLYDKDKNLIAVGSLANPVKKTENREFLFKIRVDF